MSGPLRDYLTNDHNMLDALLEFAIEQPGVIEPDAYSDFRKRLLRHISIEEKIVLPAIERWQGGRKAPMQDRLHMDHGVIASLLVPPPTRALIRTLQSIFAAHNPIEENEDGLYDLFEKLAGLETDKYLVMMKEAPEVRVLPHNDRPDLLEFARQTLLRAGYQWKP
jgi:hypothetical protein